MKVPITLIATSAIFLASSTSSVEAFVISLGECSWEMSFVSKTYETQEELLEDVEDLLAKQPWWEDDDLAEVFVQQSMEHIMNIHDYPNNDQDVFGYEFVGPLFATAYQPGGRRYIQGYSYKLDGPPYIDGSTSLFQYEYTLSDLTDTTVTWAVAEKIPTPTVVFPTLFGMLFAANRRQEKSLH